MKLRFRLLYECVWYLHALHHLLIYEPIGVQRLGLRRFRLGEHKSENCPLPSPEKKFLSNTSVLVTLYSLGTRKCVSSYCARTYVNSKKNPLTKAKVQKCVARNTRLYTSRQPVSWFGVNNRKAIYRPARESPCRVAPWQ